jgi:hypothetical protein
MMIRIEYPPHSFKIKDDGGHELIFDELRKSWLRLTPEEWVRQNFVQYLLRVKKYPGAYIAIEKEIQLGELRKRFDILIYDKNHSPWMMIECKEMNVDLSEKVFQQLLRYNIAVPVTYLVLTNGSYCVGYAKTAGKLHPLKDLPSFTT